MSCATSSSVMALAIAGIAAGTSMRTGEDESAVARGVVVTNSFAMALVIEETAVSSRMLEKRASNRAVGRAVPSWRAVRADTGILASFCMLIPVEPLAALIGSAP